MGEQAGALGAAGHQRPTQVLAPPGVGLNLIQFHSDQWIVDAQPAIGGNGSSERWPARKGGANRLGGVGGWKAGGWKGVGSSWYARWHGGWYGGWKVDFGVGRGLEVWLSRARGACDAWMVGHLPQFGSHRLITIDPSLP